jgi:hypothetical protein
VATRERILNCARSVESLAPAVSGLSALEDMHRVVDDAVNRGYFSPAEDDQLWPWYARYLTARRGLQEVVQELRPETGAAEEDDLAWQAFTVAYTASALQVRAARYLVEDLARSRLVRRKLNERNLRHRIPRKQFTAIYRNLTHPVNAWRLRDAVVLADRHRSRILELASDGPLAGLVVWLEQAEPSLRMEPRRAIRGHLRYRWHAWRRRSASSLKLGRFKVLEACGRAVSELQNPWHRHRVSERVQLQLVTVLEPGDVIVTRRHDNFTNLFLPGFWPHAMLYLGERSPSGTGPILEARKDGVRLRTLAEALDVDAFSVIRPRAAPSTIDAAIERALTHVGKLYDFDFDFFTSDRLVCTELIYRTYDGLGEIRFKLTERAGKPTLSAEDILGMAVQGIGFDPLAVFGIRGTRRQLVRGERAGALIANSLEASAP